MVRLKIAYWEFDFEAVCPTLDHDLLSQAHSHIYILNNNNNNNNSFNTEHLCSEMSIT